ncbi:MAG TPA: TlpA family protein disulfide reductase [bacterium (Candidatus Stahlbacteria)]|nr:TlpA family protein disulfide reductase [Candidatus Stahlbacteria bacterium]
MFKLVKILIVNFLGILILINAQSVAAEGLKISQLAPHFKLKKLNGSGAVVSKDTFPCQELTVLIFWDSYCPECLDIIAECQKFYKKADSLGVAVLSINFDRENIAGVRAFVKGVGITFPVLSDSRATVAALYQADPYDFSFFIIDKKGIIRYVCYEIPLDIYDHPSHIVKFMMDQVEKLLKTRIPEKSSKPKPKK